MTFSHSIVIIKDCFLKLLIDQPILFTFFPFRFINARRRIVQPMIDQSNRAGELDLMLIAIISKLTHLTR